MAMATTIGALPEAEHNAQLRKAVIASTIGTAIEWYDFFLYGTAAGLVFGKLYFPNPDALTGTLLAFGTYFIGFVGRPIGAAIFGHYGDRIGRKATLIATLLCMGFATFAIAFVPTYSSIGIWGAVLSDRAARDAGHRRRRRMGWLGAVGDGVVAHPRPARSGGVVAAIRRPLRAACCRISRSLPSAHGRAPTFWPGAGAFRSRSRSFWSGSACGSGSASSRRRCSSKLLDNDKIEKAPILEVIKKQPKEIFWSALLRLSEQAPFYVFTAFVFAYAVGTLKMDRNFILSAVMAAACVSFFTIPLAGHLSDKIGRKKMYLIGVVAMGLFGFLYFGMVDTAVPSAVFIAIVLSLIPHDMQYGPQAALIAEAFTPRLRYSGASLGYQLASIIAGGPAPLIATALFADLSFGLCDRHLHRRPAPSSASISASFMPDYTGKDISAAAYSED